MMRSVGTLPPVSLANVAKVLNTPGKNTNSAAELAMALLLAVTRKLTQAHQTMQQHGWNRHRFQGMELMGKTIGIIVDAVSEVLRVSNDQIAPPPPTVAGLEQEYLTGLVKLENQLLMLLDVDKILGKEDSEVIDSITASA